jgi:hypothetical protein
VRVRVCRIGRGVSETKGDFSNKNTRHGGCPRHLIKRAMAATNTSLASPVSVLSGVRLWKFKSGGGAWRGTEAEEESERGVVVLLLWRMHATAAIREVKGT